MRNERLNQSHLEPNGSFTKKVKNRLEKKDVDLIRRVHAGGIHPTFGDKRFEFHPP